MKKLVVVESPAKAKTISSVLGHDYTVRASLGHVRDLPADEMGVDLEHNFKPTYHILRAKSKTLKQLREALAGSNELYLATDPDREGEAIAWHLLQVLKPKVPVRRVMFHAITPADIQAAFNQPRVLDMHLVDAQQARRVLDRLVGYQVSPLLWKSTGGKSAGRVQSVALRLVVEREREIRDFVPQEYWSIHADLAKQNDQAQHFLARLVQIGHQKVGLDQAIPLKTKEEAERVIADLAGAIYRVKDLKTERKARKPWPPFTTSTLQQAASARLHLSPAETMKIAQELDEGIDIGEGRPVGLITYMRTDSTTISPEAQAAVRQMITETLGAKYLPDAAPQYKTKVKNAQEAHEAIRPTEVYRYPNNLKQHLSPRQFQLYDLIWRRFVASQMAPALYDVTTVNVLATVAGQPPFLFRAVGRDLIFDGFLRVWGVGESTREEEKNDEEDEPQALPALSVNELLDLLALIPKQHFTQPPGRYTESALVKALEERGIGRPSTYAAIIKTLKEREYVWLDKRVLAPTPLGEATCAALIAAFPDVMSYQFTAQVEDWLDDVSRGERDWVKALRDFYDPFALALASAPPKMAAFKGQYSGKVTVQPDTSAPGEENAEDKASPKKRTRHGPSGSRRSPSREVTRQKSVSGDPHAPLCPK
ncbi:MAG TPA: type I DNA topoisomerase, partial [Anaerolineae bacterium]|nr:type I DNA topoisomerase [Anaerolineae bacterium]